MKIVLLNYSDHIGGASRAAYRLHNALKNNNINSLMWVNNKKTINDFSVISPTGIFKKVLIKIRPYISWVLTKTLKTNNSINHSPSVFSSNWLHIINSSDIDIIHLHWPHREMLSISDIGKIKKPIVWTLHDMWAFCGAEHYTNDSRWIEGYKANNRPKNESGFDLNMWTWKRKFKHWKIPIQIVTPSNWLATCTRKSALMKNWQTSVIPNPINTEFWKPLDKGPCRDYFNLPKNIPLVLYGAIDGTKDQRKGFDLLKNSLKHLQNNIALDSFQLVVFGKSKPEYKNIYGFKINYLGQIDDDFVLRKLYSAVNAMVIPSRQENLPNTGLEAHACALPLIAFHIGGMSDIVDNKHSGYLAKPFDIQDLANGIDWVIKNSITKNLSINARERAISLFSDKVIVEQYMSLYKKILIK